MNVPKSSRTRDERSGILVKFTCDEKLRTHLAFCTPPSLYTGIHYEESTCGTPQHQWAQKSVKQPNLTANHCHSQPPRHDCATRPPSQILLYENMEERSKKKITITPTKIINAAQVGFEPTLPRSRGGRSTAEPNENTGIISQPRHGDIARHPLPELDNGARPFGGYTEG